MAPELKGGVVLAFLLLLILARLPIAIALFVAGLAGYAWVDGLANALNTMALIPGDLIKGYSFSVIPLFVLMGAIATRGGISDELFRISRALAPPRARGEMAGATIGACALFGAICGSSIATAATMSRVAIPQMRAGGYSDALAAGAVASGGTLGILIPPSVILVIYALLAEASVPDLFAAALIPGIILTVFCLLVAGGLVLINPHWAPPSDLGLGFGARLRQIAAAWKLASVFFLSIGGIYLGWFSPTEAAAVGAFAILVIAVVTRALTWLSFRASVREAVATSAMLFLVYLGALMFAKFIVLTGLPNTLSETVLAWGVSPAVVVLVIVIFYIILGCFLETVSMILVTVPVFLPLMQGIGYDAIWFGIVVVVVAEMGLITPPVGMNIFVIRSVFPDMTFRSLLVGILPFTLAHMSLLVLLVFAPEIVHFLPDLLR